MQKSSNGAAPLSAAGRTTRRFSAGTRSHRSANFGVRVVRFLGLLVGTLALAAGAGFFVGWETSDLLWGAITCSMVLWFLVALLGVRAGFGIVDAFWFWVPVFGLAFMVFIFWELAEAERVTHDG